MHITTSDGSLEFLLRPQLEAFLRAGYEVVGVSGPGDFVASIEAAGIRHVAHPHATRSMSPGDDLRWFVDLVRLFRKEKPDIVHTHTPKPGWLGRVAARVAGVPVVVNTVHGLYTTPRDPWPRRLVVYALERLAAAFSDVELVQNPEDVDVLGRLRIPARKLVLLSNGIDLERFRPQPPEVRQRLRVELGIADDEVLIGTVGRVVWEKGIRELLSAARELHRTAPQARVVVVGPLDAPKGDGLLAHQLADIEAVTGVRFVGERLDVEDLYAAFDIFVLASHREGFPRSAMEAAASGLPVVATNIRGCRQVVDHERNGFLVAPGDGVALGAALARLVHDEELRRRFGAEGVARAAAEFDQRSVIDITLQTYRRLLDRSRPTGPATS